MMISRIEGELVEVADDSVYLKAGPMTYRILVPRYDVSLWESRLGETVELHTIHFLESQGQGNSFTPRLLGFVSAPDRTFFERFTTVKGIGPRKALRALALPIPTVAAAIAERDLDLLKSLPEIGRRTAETIVAELSGKVDEFLQAVASGVGAGHPPAGDEPGSARHTMINDALAVLVRLGEPRPQARQWIDRALSTEPEINDAQTLVTAAYRVKYA